jgi:Flp pilus assembly protein TadD
MRNRAVCLFIFTAAVLFLGLSDVRSQGIGDRNRPADGDGQFGIQGRVVLPNGKPAQNAPVYINSADSPSINSRTDMNGIFQVGSVRAGNYRVTVRVPGFPAETETVIIDRFTPPGRTVNVVLNLRPEARESSPAADDQFPGVPRSAAEKYRRGVEKLRLGENKAAVAEFEAAVADHPRFAEAHYELGSAYLKEKSLDKALAAFVKAVELDPNYFEAKYSVGYTHYLKKNYEIASAIFVDVLKHRRNFPEAFLYLGVSLYYLKNSADAEKALKAALLLKDDASTALAHRFLGGMYLQANRKAEAAAELQKYLELVPAAPDAARLRTTIEELKKNS